MLKGISKLLTGDVLKLLCDMGHGDELVIADAHFPAETLARRLVRLPGLDGVAVLKAFNALGLMRSYRPMPTEAVAAAMARLAKSGREGTGIIASQDILTAV